MKKANDLASRLRHRIAIEQAVSVADSGGGFVTSWNEIASVWAEIKPRRGSERLRFGQIEESNLMLITIRYRESLTEDMRIVFGERIFNVRSIVNVNEENFFLEILAEEGVAS